MVKEPSIEALPRLRGRVGRGSAILTLTKLGTLAPLARSRSPSPPQAGGGKNGTHHMWLATRTMTGQRMTMNSTGKMHTIIGTESLAGKA